MEHPPHSPSRHAELGSTVHHLVCEVGTRSKPRPGSQRHTYVCDAVIRISEGDRVREQEAVLTVHHPRGWMGVAAEFQYDLDEAEFPTFDDRVDEVRQRVLEEFSPDELVSVFLLGAGDPDYDEEA